MDDSCPVLLFDGGCGLCVRCVRILLKADRGRRLRFALLQGGAAQAFLRERGLSADNYESAIFIADWGRRLVVAPLVRTDALIAAIGVIGSALMPLAWLRFLPRTWRDAAYRWVARNRQRFFGTGDVAELLQEFGSERFIMAP
jgi:predicted DCC family thiol-disulfide oxidoreductase YuxK